MITSFISQFLLKILKSPWFWVISLVGVIVVLFLLWRSALKESDRWESNYNAQSTFIGETSQQVNLKKGEFKDKEKEWVKKLKEYKIPLNRVKYVHSIKWLTSNSDTVIVYDTIIKYQGHDVTAEYASKMTPDSCLFIEYIKTVGDSIGIFNHKYMGEIDVICHRERPTPKFWNWLKGKWNMVVTIKSPCFGDTNIVFNKKIEILK